MTVKIEIAGLKAVEAALRELVETKFIRAAGFEALRSGALPIRDKAKALAPKDKLDLEHAIKAQRGRSRDDILWFEIGVDPSVQPAVYVGRKSGRGTYRDPGVAGVAPMQEFGTPNMPANPFMLPAWDSEQAATPGRIVTSLGPAIEKQAAKIARKTARAGK